MEYWRTKGDIFAVAVRGEGVDGAIHSLAGWPSWKGPLVLSHRRERWVASKKLPKCFRPEGHEWSLDTAGRAVCKHCLTYSKEGVYYW